MNYYDKMDSRQQKILIDRIKPLLGFYKNFNQPILNKPIVDEFMCFFSNLSYFELNEFWLEMQIWEITLYDLVYFFNKCKPFYFKDLVCKVYLHKLKYKYKIDFKYSVLKATVFGFNIKLMFNDKNKTIISGIFEYPVQIERRILMEPNIMRWTSKQYIDYMKSTENCKQNTNSKKSKYKNVKAMVDNISFDSKTEAKFYLYLKACGYEIILQPKFELQAAFIDNMGKKHRAINYIADFQVGNVIIDVKGFKTQSFRIKEKLFQEKYPQYQLWVGKYNELVVKTNSLICT